LMILNIQPSLSGKAGVTKPIDCGEYHWQMKSAT
jgi:hypothetical protein